MKLFLQIYNWMSKTLKGSFFTGIAVLILFGGLLSIFPLLILSKSSVNMMLLRI
jgi:hypothetical protein